MRSFIQLSIVGLVAADAVVFLLLWQVVTSEPLPIPPLPHSPSSSASNPVTPPIKRVSRRADPMAARLFTPPLIVHQSETTRPEAASPQPEPGLRLIGVILAETSDVERIALVEYGQPVRVARLRIGSQLNPPGWQVDEISTSSIRISRGAEHRILKLD